MLHPPCALVLAEAELMPHQVFGYCKQWMCAWGRAPAEWGGAAAMMVRGRGWVEDGAVLGCGLGVAPLANTEIKGRK